MSEKHFVSDIPNKRMTDAEMNEAFRVARIFSSILERSARDFSNKYARFAFEMSARVCVARAEEETG